MRINKTLLLLLGVSILCGCDKSPYERTQNTSTGATGNFGSGAYVVFSSELISGGGAFEYPGSEGQSLTFSDRSNPLSNRSIRYHWTGEAVAGQRNFAGFTLMHTATQPEYTSTVGRDLRAAGYSKVKFYARGSLSTNTFVKIEVADDGTSATINGSCVSLSTGAHLDDTVNPGANACGRRDDLTADWQLYEVPIVSPATALAALKDFFKVTFIYNDPTPGSQQTGQGGTIFIDQIRYEP